MEIKKLKKKKGAKAKHVKLERVIFCRFVSFPLAARLCQSEIFVCMREFYCDTVIGAIQNVNARIKGSGFFLH